MEKQNYDFAIYGHEVRRESFWLAGCRLHDVFERVVPSLYPKEFDPKEALDCVANLWGVEFDPDFDEGPCDYRVRVSFDGAKSGTPEIGMFLGLEGIENFDKIHRIPLTIISNYPKFKKLYGENYFENSKLRDVLLGGIMNVYGKISDKSYILLSAYLTNWILYGPLFDVFWRTRSFDIHVPSKYKPLADQMKSFIVDSWTPSINYYAANEARIAEIRKKAPEWRKNSKICMGLKLDHPFLQNVVAQLIDVGELDTAIPIHQEFGWDAEKKVFDRDLRKPMHPDKLLETIENNSPSYIFEINLFTSPLQGLYSGMPSPSFLLRRMGVQMWNLIIDPIDAALLHFDLMAKQIVGNNTAIFFYQFNEFKKEPGIVYFPVNSFPDEFNRSEKRDAPFRKYAKKLNFNEPKGVLIATNLRKHDNMGQWHPLTRRLCFLSCLKRGVQNDIFNSSPLLELLVHSLRPGGWHAFPLDDYTKIEDSLGYGIFFGTTKVLLITQVQDICEKNSIPCRVHCSESWIPQNSDWHGYVPKSEITKLGQEGWVHFSFYESNWGAPYHDVHDGLLNGALTVCPRGNAPTDDDMEIMKKFSFERENFASLERCITRAMNDPHTVYDALLRAMSGHSGDNAPPDPETAGVIANMLRRGCAEPVFSDQQVSDILLRKSYESVPDDIKQKLKSRELADFIRSYDPNEICEDAVARGASRKYVQYMREFFDI